MVVATVGGVLYNDAVVDGVVSVLLVLVGAFVGVIDMTEQFTKTSSTCSLAMSSALARIASSYDGGARDEVEDGVERSSN